MRILFPLCFSPPLFLVARIFAAGPLSVTCIGPSTAPSGIVYLHGLEGEEISRNEKRHREIMRKISKKYGLRIAIPKSNSRCGLIRKKYCWKQTEITGIKATLALIELSTRNCLGNQKRRGIIGFSNGGYLVNKFFQYCLPHGFSWIISAGSAGRLHPGVKSLEACGKLILLIGKKDITYNKTVRFYRQLKEVGANARLVEFDGGHGIPEKVLVDLLEDPGVEGKWVKKALP